MSTPMQWPYDSHHRVSSGYGFNQYNDSHTYHRNNNDYSDYWSYPVNSYEQPYYDNVYDECHYNSSILQEMDKSMFECRNSNQKILEQLQLFREQSRKNMMLLEQLLDKKKLMNQTEEEREGVDNQCGSPTFTGTFDDEESDYTLHNGTQTLEPLMPADSQPQPDLECKQLSLLTDNTPISHSSDVYPDSETNLEDTEVMNSPECLYNLNLASHRLEELGGDLTSTPPRQDGFGASNTFIIASQPLFTFDLGTEHSQVFFINSPKRAKIECLSACTKRKQYALGLNFSAVLRPIWIHFPFDVKHYRWSELVSVRLGTENKRFSGGNP